MSNTERTIPRYQLIALATLALALPALSCQGAVDDRARLGSDPGISSALPEG